MSHPIPEDAQRLADRLRMAADEIESMARYGVPIPSGVGVNGFEYGGMTMSALHGEFPAWAEYFEAEVEHYDHSGHHWSKAHAEVNGLRVSFAAELGPVEKPVPALAFDPRGLSADEVAGKFREYQGGAL